jgi:nucleotide-binding universal stress UspA family protein
MDPKKILVGVDASENSLRAVAYVAEIVGPGSGFEVELLCVDRVPVKDLYPSEDAWAKAAEAQQAKIREFLAKARDLLAAKGFDPDRLNARCVAAEGPSIATAIVEEQRAGGFGTVVVGRRGLSKAEEFLLGSVSTRVVHLAKGCAIWVVG